MRRLPPGIPVSARGSGNVRGHSIVGNVADRELGGFDQFTGRDPSPAFLLMVEERHHELLRRLRDDTLRQVALLRMEGYANEEIAARLTISLRSVERKLRLIREEWLSALDEESSGTLKATSLGATSLHTDPDETQRVDRRAMANQIDALCDAFEKALRMREHPVIENYLERGPRGEQLLLLKELLALEVEFLYQTHDHVDSAEYVARFPQAKQLVRDVLRRASTAPANLTMTSLPVALASSAGDKAQSLSEPLVEVQRLATEQAFARGEPLVRQGEEANSLMVIREGAVEIRVEEDDGTIHVIGCLGAGQVLGEMALLTSEPRTASAVATEPVRAAVLPVESFHNLCSRYPQMSELLTELIAERLGNAQQDALTDKRLDRYRILRRLGRGGMSVVYEAIDTVKESKVALKMMSHRLVCSPAALHRFQLEASIIEGFDHPHIVSMYGRFAAFRTYFIVMEYCGGETLAEYIERHGALDEAAFRRALAQLALALRHAHESGIIHRDIKPANVMRLPDGTLKLMDFGLAEPIATESAKDGDVVGTPRYMAPEQRLGETVDERADYFSLGCVAYEMLTGAPLFTRSVLHEIIRDFREWARPDFAHLGNSVTTETARLLQPMLAVDPNDRLLDIRAISSWSE